MASINTRGAPKSQGYITLLSSILVGFFLMSVVIAQNTDSFSTRFRILEYEFKTKSLTEAFSCAQYISLRVVYDQSYQGEEKVRAGIVDCMVGEVSYAGSDASFNVMVMYKDVYTTLDVTVDSQSGLVIRWKESL